VGDVVSGGCYSVVDALAWLIARRTRWITDRCRLATHLPRSNLVFLGNTRLVNALVEPLRSFQAFQGSLVVHKPGISAAATREWADPAERPGNSGLTLES
jgi:hypothetical protein